MKTTIKNIEIEQLVNAGCNNGNYPQMEIHLSNGDIVPSMTCRCGNGCSGTDRVPEIGESWEEYLEEINE